MKKLTTLILGAVLLIGACSSGSTSTSAGKPAANPTTTMTTSIPSGTTVGAAQLELSARAYITAFIERDADAARRFYTDRCRKTISSKDLAKFMESSGKSYSGVKITKLSSKISGETATVDYKLSEPSLSKKGERWEVENGTWHNDDC